MHDDKNTSGLSDPSYQDKDIRLMIVVISVASIIVAAIGTAIGCAYLLKHYMKANETAQVGTPAYVYESQLPPEPRLQVVASEDLQAHRDYEDAQLEHYAWVNEAQGTVRIPIERAMALLVAEGLPVRSEPQPEEAPAAEEPTLP